MAPAAWAQEAASWGATGAQRLARGVRPQCYLVGGKRKNPLGKDREEEGRQGKERSRVHGGG